MQITGLDQISEKMKSVTRELRFKGGRFGMRKAANFVAQQAKLRAQAMNDPQTAEDISKNIAVRFSSRYAKQTGDIKFRVGVLGGAKQYANTKENVRKGRAGGTYKTGGDKSNPGGDTFYWRYLEFGTSKIAARPFMRPAIENNVEQTIGIFATEANKAIDRALKKAAKVG